FQYFEPVVHSSLRIFLSIREHTRRACLPCSLHLPAANNRLSTFTTHDDLCLFPWLYSSDMLSTYLYLIGHSSFWKSGTRTGPSMQHMRFIMIERGPLNICEPD